jgi:hypothetical protein
MCPLKPLTSFVVLVVSALKSLGEEDSNVITEVVARESSDCSEQDDERPMKVVKASTDTTDDDHCFAWDNGKHRIEKCNGEKDDVEPGRTGVIL